MTISELHNRLRGVKHASTSAVIQRSSRHPSRHHSRCLVESEVIWGSQWGLHQEEFLTPQALRSRWGCHWSGLGHLQNGAWGLWAPGPVQVCVPRSEPTSTDTVKDQGGWGAGLVAGFILAQQDLVLGNSCSSRQPLPVRFLWGRICFLRDGVPTSRPVETPRVVPGWDSEVLGDLPQEVALTISSARAPSTRRAYALKWNLFVEWCSSHHEDPQRCSIRAVLSFLHLGLEHRLSPSILEVYVGAISAQRDPIEGRSVVKHDLVIRVLRGPGG